MHSIKCENCHRAVAPDKDSVSFQLGMNIGFFAIVIPAIMAIHIFHTNFITAVIAGLIVVLIAFIFDTTQQNIAL